MNKDHPGINGFGANLFKKTWSALTIVIILTPNISEATQAHAAPEGLYSHQLAHIFFLISLCWLVYWLQKRRLPHEPGWRQIQYAGICLILWNIDAFLAHLMDEQLLLVEIQRVGIWYVNIDSATNRSDLIWIYYLLKLDHLLCVPAMCFFYVGLKRLLNANVTSQGKAGLTEVK